MKITLYMASTIDGFIAKNDGDSDWVSPVDNDNFMSQIHEKGCLIVGRTTYEQFLNDLYPVEGVMNVVMTSQPKTSDESKNVHFVTGTPAEAIQLIESKGLEKALLIGGGTTNAHFLAAGLIDEIVLTIHPLILGQGIPLFTGEAVEGELEKRLQLLETKQLADDLVQVKYRIEH